MKKTNEEILKMMVEKQGFKLGCYDKDINLLNRDNLNKVINSFFSDSGDVDVFINRKLHVVEMSVVDNEVDFTILTKNEYIDRYGYERWDEE